jgi:hypothetical protein
MMTAAVSKLIESFVLESRIPGAAPIAPRPNTMASSDAAFAIESADASVRPWRDARMLFAPRLHPNLKVIQPFEVAIERTDLSIVATISSLGLRAEGADLSHALVRLGRMILERYRLATADVKHRLDAHIREQVY